MWDLNPRTHKPNFMRYNHLANFRSNLFMTIRFFDGNSGIEPLFQAWNA